MGRFARSWEVTKLTFSVMAKEKELFVFPILSSVFSLIFLAILLVPTILISIFSGESVIFTATEYILILISYFGVAFIATFFNVCVSYTAALAFAGQEARFSTSMRFAFSRIHVIFLWTLLSATVGLIFKIIEGIARKIKGIGALVIMILNALFKMAWSIVTIFVIPGLVYHNLKPFAAIKKSVEVLKKTWGETLIKYIGFGIAEFMLILPAIIIGIVIAFLVLPVSFILSIIIILILIIYVIIIALVFGVANQIFNTALYAYAESGRIPGPYTQDIMQNAFRSKKKKPLGI